MSERNSAQESALTSIELGEEEPPALVVVAAMVNQMWWRPNWIESGEDMLELNGIFTIWHRSLC
jgi:hypothetical protein